MKKKRQKVITIVLVVLLLLLSIGMTVGCVEKDKKLKTDTFRYHVVEVDGEDRIAIDGLTEKGRLQKNIVIPEEIDGKKVFSYRGSDEAPNVKKIIIPYNVRIINSFFSQGNIFVHDYPAGLKVIYVNCEYVEGANFGMRGFIATNAEKGYRKHYESLWAYKFANMQYMFNYDSAPNGGVAFVDDLEVNEKIEIIPMAPKRDGYLFTGWYMEPECIKKIIMEDYVKTDEEIVYLYAGWEENK